ncbi:MAG: hypothetical protein Q4D29_03985 [Lachnospiraceae bacterium]|nr:hypothetical protein [Lachnospiraceae bacterium]
MKYKCENELNTLSFKDFGLSSVSYTNGKLTLMTDGGIARYDNSCNEMLEERYISECEITFFDANILRFFKEGGKYFDANDKLIEEYPDVDIDPSEYEKMLKELTKEGVIFFLSSSKTEARPYYELSVDVVNDTYWINIDASKVIVGFERFMNKVVQ